MSEDTNQTNLDDFMGEVKTQEEDHRKAYGGNASGEFEDRTTLKAERDKLYEGYILEGYTSAIDGQYGKNTAARLTSATGEKLTLWVSGYEEQHFVQFCERLDKQGTTLPVKISFARTQKTAEKSGRTYNRIMIRLDASGEEVQLELDSL